MEYPDIDKMAKELKENGWFRHSIGVYIAPWGGRYLGPFQAWKAMKGILRKEGIFGEHA